MMNQYDNDTIQDEVSVISIWSVTERTPLGEVALCEVTEVIHKAIEGSSDA